MDGQDGKERTLSFCFRGELGTGVTWTLFPGQLGRPPAKEQPQPQHVSRWEGRMVLHPGLAAQHDLHGWDQGKGWTEGDQLAGASVRA